MVSIQLFFGHNVENEFKLCKYFPQKLHHADYTLKCNSRWWEKKDLANFVLLKSIAPNSGFPRVLEASNKLKKRILYRMLHIHKPPTMTDHDRSSGIKPEQAPIRIFRHSNSPRSDPRL
ncbi:hypothetical protein HMPREF1322_0306 [Porphyromonas gingivalis W50]|nr:hypothetical protein PGA7_00013340 [Porphyromonas gingivalis]EIW92409.1 hypothetical protein HMPREF1322_0306 [Porphyromonas gingivalis W50]